MLRGDADLDGEAMGLTAQAQQNGTKLDGFRPRAEDEQRPDHICATESDPGLAMPEGDAAFRQIVGGEFHGDAIAGQDANPVAAEAPRQVRQNDALMFQLHAKKSARELFENGTGYFNAVFFTQSDSFW